VANDSVPNTLWRNEGAGEFVDVGLPVGLALSESGGEQAGMGAAAGDANGDGLVDLFVTNFSEDYHTLYRNDGNGFFTDVTSLAGLARTTRAELGWGCAFLDHDNDGDQDLFAANGHVYPQVDEVDFGTSYHQRNQLFENRGDGRFVEATGRAGPGFEVAAASRGAAVGDVDDDGDLDVLVGNLDGPPTLLRNDGGNARPWIKVRLLGTRSPREPVGARVAVTAAGRTQVQWHQRAGSFLSSHDPRLHFGLGDAERVAAIEVRWPSGDVERVGPVEARRLVVIEEGRGVVSETALR
jgi:hypothetical protein